MHLHKLQVNIKGRFLSLTTAANLTEKQQICLDIFCCDERLINRLVIDYGKNDYKFSDNITLSLGEKKKLKKVLKPYLEYLIR